MAKPIILAVDDDPQVLRSVARDLRRQYGETYRILRADGGEAALDVLDQLKERGDPVALVLSDQRMPKMEGVELLGYVRERFPAAKRALLTAYADTDAAIGAINKSQVDYYLLKPWDPPHERLYPILDDLLADWKAGYRPGFGGVRVVGDRWNARAHELKDFLARNHVPYTFLDVEQSDEARALVDAEEGALPLVILPEGERLNAPTPQELAEHVGLQMEANDDFYDLAIVGGGPAGLATAVYGASEGLRTVLIEGEATGGQAGTSSRIENYLGFPSGLSGADLARRATDQAKRFGVEILAPQHVEALRMDGPYKYLTLQGGGEVSCHTVMLAIGVAWRKLPAENADDFTGRGVYYGAAMTEAMSCTDEHVCVVGAGNSAGQAALHFAEYAKRVTMLVRGDSLAAKMSHYLVDRIEASEVIDVQLNAEIATCEGDEHLESVALEGTNDRIETRYVFVFIGAAPRTDWLGDAVARDDRGFILTGPDIPKGVLADWPLDRDPFLLETSVPGVFASGDVRHDSVKRVASAVGEGSVSVHFMHHHLASL